MSKYLLLISCLIISLSSAAQDSKPHVTGTLPVIYINTADNTPITSKTEYIQATYWVDPNGAEGIDPIGNADEPLPLQIRGRGNASWGAPQKPYKLKLDSKASMLGMPKSKHWVLLNGYSGNWNWLPDVIGKHLAQQIGLGWVPGQKPVELVLNGEYQGFYRLSENVRIDDGRLEIFEQKDQETVPALIEGGWLVEVDNYVDECQIELNERDGLKIKITYHTPEDLSPQQEQWLIDEFNKINSLIYCTDKSSREWEEYLDVRSLAKFFIIQDIMDNTDGFVGSFYLHKDLKPGARWTAGPVWDIETRPRQKETFTHEIEPEKGYAHWIDELMKFPVFRQAVAEEWHSFYPCLSELNDWATGYTQPLEQAMIMHNKLWLPDNPLSPGYIKGWTLRCTNKINSDIEWFDKRMLEPDFADPFDGGAPAPIVSPRGELLINEVMQSNINTLADDNGIYPYAWIELYNPGDSEINLGHYTLHDTNDLNASYRLPDQTLAPNQHYLLWCDDRLPDSCAPLTVRLTKGCSYYITNSDGAIVDKVTIIDEAPAPDVAYGREYDGAEAFGYMLQPTPGYANSGGIVTADRVLAKVKFNEKSRIIHGNDLLAIELSLDKKAPADAVIIYTTDGSLPSLTNGSRYTQPITINATTVIKAQAFCEGYISTAATANTYVFNDQRSSIGSLILTSAGRDGVDSYLSAVNVEYFDGNSQKRTFSQNAYMVKSNGCYNITAMPQYDDGTFKYPLWHVGKPDVKSTNTFDIIPASYTTPDDQLSRTAIQYTGNKHLGLPWRASVPADVYFDGVLIGNMQIAETLDDNFFNANMGCAADFCTDASDDNEALYSDLRYDMITVWLRSNPDYLNEHFDVNSLLSVMAMAYITNDFDNVMDHAYVWRARSGDSRWHWMLNNSFKPFRSNLSVPGVIVRYNKEYVNPALKKMLGKIMDFPEINERLQNMIIAYSGDILNPETFNSTLNDLTDNSSLCDQAYANAYDRADDVPDDFMADFGYTSAVRVNINKSAGIGSTAPYTLTYNGIELYNATFDGYDYVDRKITLTADSGDDEQQYNGWRVSVNGDERETHEGLTITYTLDQIADYQFDMILKTSRLHDMTDGIDYTFDAATGIINAAGYTTVFDMMGVVIASGTGTVQLPQPGIYILASTGSKPVKIIWTH